MLLKKLLVLSGLSVIVFGWFISGCDPSTSSVNNVNDSAQILLTSPQGGALFHVGDTIHVKWTITGKSGVNGSITAVDVRFSPDGGKTWAWLNQNSLPPATISWPWKIPDSLNISGLMFDLKANAKCLMRVEQYSPIDPNQMSTTQSTFRIDP